MTKNEIINEIKSVVMNNGGEVNLGWVTISVINGEVVRTLHGYSKNVKSEKVAQIQIYLDCLNDMEAETVEKSETVEVEPKATKKDILFKCIWGAFRYFSNMERHEVGDYEFAHLVRDMYQTICGEIETDSEWDEYFDIEKSMLAIICEDMGCKLINKNHPNESCYDTIILPSA